MSDENDNKYRFESKQGTKVIVSKDWKRVCPDCRRAVSIEEFGLREMPPDVRGNVVIRDQPKCGQCRHERKEAP